MYYKELNLPSIPNSLLEEPFIPEMGTDDIGYGGEHFKNGKKLNPCSYWFCTVKNKELLSWLWKNIPVTRIVSRIMYQQAYHESEGYHVVHSDISRSYAINYMIELGGDDVWVSWYKEKDRPLRRMKQHGGTQADSGHVSYDNLELLENAKFEKNKWYIITADILHDVGVITGFRKSITISIPSYLEKQAFETLGLTWENSTEKSQ